MKYLVIGDIHFVKDYEVNNKILNFLKNSMENYDNVIFLGDLYDKYENFYYFMDFLKFLVDNKDKNFYIIEGNHDFEGSRKYLKYFDFFMVLELGIR